MADFVLGRIKFVWKGAWAASTSYIADDVVRYGGNAFIALLTIFNEFLTAFSEPDWVETLKRASAYCFALESSFIWLYFF